MARTWLSIRVDLVDGMHAPDLWPRPGRVLLARPGMTFRMLADAINDAFARWDRSHLHAFTFDDGTRIALRTDWDEDEHELDDRAETLTRLRLGERFSFEFDFGDSWMHLCTVAEEKVDPREVYGEVPDRPVPYVGWGAIPDQYGRRWDGDDGEGPVPPPPEPLLSDLPDLHHDWGSRAFTPTGTDDGEVIPGPWATAATPDHSPSSSQEPWTYETIQEVRRAARGRDAATLVDLLLEHDPLEVAHVTGPGLIHAVEVGHPPARLVIEGLLPGLGTRGWLGDDELIDELERVTRDERSELRPTPVDLDELATHLEGSTEFDEGWKLEVATGQLWPSDPVAMAGVEAPDDFDDPDRFAYVLGLGSRVGYGDMVAFIELVTDPRLAELLTVAIDGKGAFRRFKTALFDHEHWWSRWATFSSEHQLGRARWWLAEAGLRPATTGDG